MSSSDSLDEIDQIMNEIEELQQSMATAQTPAVPSGKTSAASSASPKKVTQATVTQEVPEESSDAMAEFSSGRTETSLEETLGDLKDDEPSGPNLIDQAIEAEAAENGAADTSRDDTALLNADEADALDSEIASEEARILAEAEIEEEGDGSEQSIDETIAEIIEESVDPTDSADETIEEPLQMHEATPRRARGNSSQVPTVNVQLNGDMKLKLSYEFEGQDVTVSFNDGALKVELSDGTEFKIPVRRNPLKKTA